MMILYFRKTVFEELGGYNETFTGWEDFDLPQRMEAAYGAPAIGRIDEYIHHNEQVTSLRGLGQKRFYYARHGARKYMTVEANRGKYIRATVRAPTLQTLLLPAAPAAAPAIGRSRHAVHENLGICLRRGGVPGRQEPVIVSLVLRPLKRSDCPQTTHHAYGLEFWRRLRPVWGRARR